MRGLRFFILIPLLSGCLSLPERLPQSEQEWLDAHNAHRARHGVPPLKWSRQLAQSAQAVADSCPEGHSKTPYGENIAWVSVIKSPTQITGYWYDEEPMYDYAKPGYSFQTGHFTQLVWKQTRALGCGQAKGCNTRIRNVWICHYDPPGNYQCQFAQNVFPQDGR